MHIADIFAKISLQIFLVPPFWKKTRAYFYKLFINRNLGIRKITETAIFDIYWYPNFVSQPLSDIHSCFLHLALHFVKVKIQQKKKTKQKKKNMNINIILFFQVNFSNYYNYFFDYRKRKIQCLRFVIPITEHTYVYLIP